MQPRAESDAKELAAGASPLTSFVFTAADPNPAIPFVRLCHNLLIAVQPHFKFCASLSSVFSVRAGARRSEDFGTAGHHHIIRHNVQPVVSDTIPRSSPLNGWEAVTSARSRRFVQAFKWIYVPVTIAICLLCRLDQTPPKAAPARVLLRTKPQ